MATRKEWFIPVEVPAERKQDKVATESIFIETGLKKLFENIRG